MALKIKQDHARFRDIVRGRIKRNLKKYVQKGEMIGKKGKDFITIPIPTIDIPHFRFGERSQGGVGQGEGEPGDPLSPQEADGSGKAGQGEGQHILEVDVSLDELADILGEELALPRIEPRGKDRIVATRLKYTGISPSGPESLRHFKRTYKQALKRQIASGSYNWRRPVIVPYREDRRYRTWKQVPIPETNAVVIYMMDVSGSMGDEQKEIVRIESFWIDTWLRFQYQGIESRYIVHDAAAKEVDRDTFFHIRESGGTAISSAYKYADRMIEEEYPTDEWNLYVFHFSDGDNWSVDDTKECIRLLREKLLNRVNLFCYGQVDSPYGSGQFLKDLNREAKSDRLITSHIESKDSIYGSIKEFLGKGK